MQFVRFRKKNSSEPLIGWVYGELVGEIEGNLFGEYRRLEADTPLNRVELLAPVQPGKIVAVGWNYLDHAREFERAIPEVPTLFLKPPSSVIGTEGRIILPAVSTQVEHECELALVIGKPTHAILPEEAFSHILGYTVANDVTARDLQKKDETWTRAKGFDSFCPLGPRIETEFETADALLTCRVNGELRQMASTRDMIFPISSLLAYISAIMTLYPGDVVLTGTPAGTGPLKDGDRVECQIDGIGQLVNYVAEQQA